MKTLIIVGASLSGLHAAEALRAQGFDGRLAIVGEERHRPYDRPPLSKDFLLGTAGLDSLQLRPPEYEQSLDADWLLDRRAVALDPGGRAVELSDGSRVVGDGVIIATGATPRALRGAGDIKGLHTLRTLDDAVALRTSLATAQHVAVIGAGFIGSEVAASCRALGLEVTVVEADGVPLRRQLGPVMGQLCADLHRDNGVTVELGVGVEQVLGSGRVTGLRLTDGREIAADTVVAAIGVEPAVGWLAGSGVDLDNGVVTDAGCATAVPHVVAVGDVANHHNPFIGGQARIEHWTNGVEMAATAAQTLLSGQSATPPAKPPYFWSDQYNVRIQYAGHTRAGDEPVIVDGDTDSRSFVAVYRRGGADVAVLAMNNPRSFGRLRRALTPTSQLVG
ncbi:NAD(P)/FAD-dependent oxidoreductase [Streptomyces albidoflavus]|uniref:NAD(P)/FAD-dependent oxidoreductase n=1 Tax=Streptomyces albidoflavus TaxID=1886 RepID=UPI00101E2940|nr:FAD-dependent oxidoreductase [Streptomyces albidoflavus]RZD76777.1 FAD-dependent oxidoreductase [Streptomyces albidoflavus]